VKAKILYRVIYGDTDQMGVMYHANYLRLFEIGRNEYFRLKGILYRNMEKKGIYLPVKEAWCDYIAGARYDDVVEIRCDIKESTRSSIVFNYQVLRDEELLARGMTRHAFVNKEGRVVRLNQEEYKALIQEGS